MGKIVIPVPMSGSSFSATSNTTSAVTEAVTQGVGKRLGDTLGSTLERMMYLVASGNSKGGAVKHFPYSDTSTSSYYTLSLFQGPKPSLADIDITSVNFTFYAAYSGNILVTFPNTIYTVDTDQANNEFVITMSSSVVSKAVKTGKATWWATIYNYGSKFVNYVGDVSALGGTGEIKIEDTGIVAGQDYVLTPFSFRFPAVINIG